MSIVRGDLVKVSYHQTSYPFEYGIVIGEPTSSQIGPVVSILVEGSIKRVRAENFKWSKKNCWKWEISNLVR